MHFLSDLAIERHRADLSLAEVTLSERRLGRITLSHLRVTGAEGEASIGKPRGLYITLAHPTVTALSREERDRLTAAVGEAVRDCLPNRPRRLLAVGLGNCRLAADSLGCRVIEHICATAHLADEDTALFSALGCAAVAKLTPGVSGECGLEAAQTVAAVARGFGADAVLAFDSLAAGSSERLLTTVQITDTGIAPGSGIGSGRPPLCHDTVGVPVVGIGVPTVMRAEAYLDERLAATASHAPPCRGQSDEALFVQRQSTDAELSLLGRLLADCVNRTFGCVLD